MTIYRGSKAVCGITLTIDRVWRYVMTAGDVLTVRFADNEGTKIVQTYTSEDVDPRDKIVTVRLTESDTLNLNPGRGTIAFDMNGYLAGRPTSIFIKEEV